MAEPNNQNIGPDGLHGFSSHTRSESRQSPLSLTLAPHLVLINPHDICLSMSVLDVEQLHGKQLTSMIGGDLFNSLPVMSRTLDKALSMCRGISLQVS